MQRIVLIEVFNKLDEVAPSFSLGYLASYMLKYFGKVDIVVERSSGLIPIKLKADDIVGISVFTQNYNKALTLAKNIKNKYKSIPVIIGGPHISPLPESMSEDMDVAVLYEGEQTFFELVKTLLEYGIDKQKFRNVQGLAFMEDNQLIRTGTRQYEQNLDVFPPPARHLTIKTRPVNILDMVTSRGCPNKCTYCASSVLWPKVRFHSPEYVIQEIDQVMTDYQPLRLSFQDDLLMANRERFYKIISHIREKNYQNKADLFFWAHVNYMNEDIAEMLKGIKCNVAFGFESGSDKILRNIKTGNVTLQKNQKAIDLLSKYDNVNIVGTFMCGLPGETVEDMEMTYQFVTKNKNVHIAINPVTPLPGTQLWQYASQKGLVNSKMDWDRLRFNSKTSLAGKVLVDDAMTREELEREFHKINNYAYQAIARKYSMMEMLKLFRVDLIFIMKNILGNPRKVFNILFELITTKIKLLIYRKK